MSEENTPANATEAQDEAAFEEGFSGDKPLEQVSSEEKQEHQQEQPEVPEQSHDNEEKAVLAGLTETQIKELFGRMGEIDNLKQNLHALHDKTFGKFGEYNTRLQELQANRQQNGGNLSLKSEQLKRLHEFEPELAEILAQDLSDNLTSSQALDEARVQQMTNQTVQNAMNNLRVENEMKLLRVVHPDVDQITNTPDWKVWLSSQDEQTRQKIGRSYNAQEVAAEVSKFKNWKELSQTQTNNKQRRLESAVLPTGTGFSPNGSVSDEDAFLAGFDSA